MTSGIFGSHHMACRSEGCTFEFCYLCLADRALIIAHDNMWHVKGCPYFSPHDEEPKRCTACPLGDLCPKPEPLTEAQIGVARARKALDDAWASSNVKP